MPSKAAKTFRLDFADHERFVILCCEFSDLICLVTVVWSSTIKPRSMMISKTCTFSLKSVSKTIQVMIIIDGKWSNGLR